jgi:outer membrane protein assembly factor BamB
MSARNAILSFAAATCAAAVLVASQGTSSLPSGRLRYGFFTVSFESDGTFALESREWDPFHGRWRSAGDEVTIQTSGGPPDTCAGAGRYTYRVDGRRLTLSLVEDACVPRRMVLANSVWRPEGEAEETPERRITRTRAATVRSVPRRSSADGSWPSFRGPQASGVADGQQLPDRWNGTSGENILWRTPIPGLAHSSPVVWGDRVFVTSAISSKPNATFKPGLYGDGDASDDRSPHRWVVYALDARTGKFVWERVAFEGAPREKRHIKSTYASSTPATDGRIVVAWFGSQGVHAFDVDGNPLWSVDLGRVDMGAYNIPTYEWGPASSPIIWNDLVILQCDTQADSFLLALDAKTGTVAWKTERDELPSWGTPTVATTAAGPELVTNASNFIRGYDPRTGRELWRLGGSSKITAPTPIYSSGLFIVASGRAPERPLFAIRAGSRGDLTLAKDSTSSHAIAWSRAGRGSYMPTPLVYGGILYVLANNGVLDAYDLETGKEIYRQRLTHLGSGFSASPVAADGRVYLTNEDGEILVVAAGRQFRQIAANPMGDLLMATPALSRGVMYVRSGASLFAIGTRSSGTR